jgi:tetratricopeptide (TPR) repeat protein
MLPQNIADIFKLDHIDTFGTDLDVLVIEPQNDIRGIISQFLIRKGFGNVRMARDGVAGINELRRKPADIVIVSNSLDGPTASDVILEMQEDKGIEKRATILISQPLEKKEFKNLAILCPDEVIIKPIILNEVLLKIKKAHSNYSKHRNLERVFELAKMELRNKNYQKAEFIYQTLIKINDKLARPYFGLSRVADEQNHYLEAIQHARNAISRNVQYAHAHSLLGELMLKQGDLLSAIESFKKSLELSPLNIFRYEAISQKLMQQRYFDEAISILEIGLVSKLNQPALAERLGLCYFFKKEYGHALRFLRSAVERDPENIRFLNSLAICYRDAHQFQKSLDIYDQILRRHSNNHAVLFNKALLLWMMKRKEDALQLMKKVVALQPDFTKAQEKIMEWEPPMEDYTGDFTN